MVYHIPVLLKESINGLNINPEGIYIDLTFGGGGHSREIIKHLSSGQLFAFDQDKDAEKNLIDDNRFHFIRHNFRFLQNFLRYYGYNKVDGIIADLGVSSHHFNNAERGFSFRFNEELDMRMNKDADFKASDLLNNYSEEKLLFLFRNYGELKNSKKIAKSIIEYRKNIKINTGNELKEAIQNHIPKNQENKYLAKVFQALRIEVNNEIEALKEMLPQTINILKSGGRLVVLAYHSIEDRLVKNFIRAGNFEGLIEKDFYGNVKTPFIQINRKVIIANNNEIEINNRARSAKLRIAERK
ncbi:MAG: 16S rRNA (cytosine(1402)-N(4))-methyltransferase RsmH [Bacteroidales bacterium]|nr:16S rRNA (cytosine(1402)-N(4))-methyltransferase RsmH [Bacteroidales bacterium]